MTKLREFKGFATVRSDFYNSTPNLTVDIDRERAATYGVSTSAVQSLLRTAYSQNYVYLIKEAGRSVSQVILEVKDNERTNPGDLDNLYVRGSGSPATGAFGPSGGITTTTGTARNLVPLRAVTSSNIVVGPQAVNHFNQFTSVTINFNLLPGVAIGDATKFIEDSFTQVNRQFPGVQATVSGRSTCFPAALRRASFAASLRHLRYVRDPRDSLRKLRGIRSRFCFRPSFPPSLAVYFTLWIFGSTLSLYSVIGLFLLLGIVKKKRNHGRRFRVATNR